jgi:hypothetical protein
MIGIYRELPNKRLLKEFEVQRLSSKLLAQIERMLRSRSIYILQRPGTSPLPSSIEPHYLSQHPDQIIKLNHNMLKDPTFRRMN